MEGRCVVETWAEFGFSSCTPKVTFGGVGDVFLCTGSDEVYVFSAQEKQLKTILQFPAPVSDLIESHDKQLLYVSCRSGVYCVSSHFLLSRAPSSPSEASSSPAELKIPSEFLVVAEEGVLSLLLVGSVLLTLSQRDTSWVLTLYSSPKLSASSRYEVLTSFSRPQASGVVHSDTAQKMKMRRRPVLTCVHSVDTPSLSSSFTSSSETIGLEPVLFKLLFGIDAALAKSPVILCGLPDGCLCFLPLRVPGSRLRVLHSLEQPVVFIGASSSVEAGPVRAQCLVAVGELGRVVLIKTDKEVEGGGNKAGFIERCVPGPLVCGCMDKNCLYYSTGSDLLRLDLSEGDAETPNKTDAALQSPTSLNVCRVMALAEPTCNAAGEVQLLGLSVRGRLQRITLPVEREDARSSKVPSTQVGRSVRDLLSAIGDVCERASTMKTAIKSKNQTLRHLNQVLNISFLLMASANSEEKPIRCHAVTQWSRLLQEDSLSLTCVLHNSSSYILERGWTLSIAVFPLSYSPSAGGESPSTNFSFPFQNLHPGETLEVSVPLAAPGDASFPVTVSCSLVLSLSSVLGEEAAHLPAPQGACVSLPLNALTVDWLHALQVNSSMGGHQKATSQCDNATKDAVQAFLNSRRMRCSGGGEGAGDGASKPERKQYSASVRVSTELLRDTLLSGGSGLDPQGAKLAPQNVCPSLLGWLLTDGPGDVKTGRGGEEISGTVVHARGPNGDTVKLTAKEVNIGEESLGKEEHMATVEVQVESSSLAAVCGLHHAVLRRVQTLLQRAPDRPASAKKVQSLGLGQALRRAERLSQQIQQSRVSGAFGVGGSTGQMTRTLLGFYRELRENPLLII